MTESARAVAMAPAMPPAPAPVTRADSPVVEIWVRVGDIEGYVSLW